MPLVLLIMLAGFVCVDRFVFGSIAVDSIILDTFPAFIMMIFSLFSTRWNIGLGDIFLFAIIGIAFDVFDLITVIFFSSIIFIIVMFSLKSFISFSKNTTVGFIPFISVSTASLICF